MKQQKFNSHKANGSSFLYIAEFNFAQIHTVIFFFPQKVLYQTTLSFVHPVFNLLLRTVDVAKPLSVRRS